MRNEWLKKEIQGFKPYQVAPITVPTVINANENAKSLWEYTDVKSAVMEKLLTVAPNRYPLPYADSLRAKTAAYIGCKPEEILLGNGGDEMISLITQAFLDKGDSIVVHGPTFDMYALGAEANGASVNTVVDSSDFAHDIEEFLQVIAETNPKIVYVCNPNNPTGVLWKKNDLVRIAEAAPKVVIFDEAYMEFCDDSELTMIHELVEYPNMLILRTFSKAFGLAGCRVGYLVGQEDAINMVSKVKPPYNLNVFSQAIAEVALDYKEVLLGEVQKVCALRDEFIETVSELSHAEVFPSATNFVLLRTDRVEALQKALLEAGILAKYYSPGSALYGCLRITITTAEVNERLLTVIKEVCN